MGCMNPLPEGRAECGICGYPANGENPSLYLPVGTVLSERYLVGRVLEVGGDGAVYIGYDKVLKSAILIREFLPDTLCGRAENGTSVAVIGGCENTFRDYRERFRTHARALAPSAGASVPDPSLRYFRRKRYHLHCGRALRGPVAGGAAGTAGRPHVVGRGASAFYAVDVHPHRYALGGDLSLRPEPLQSGAGGGRDAFTCVGFPFRRPAAPAPTSSPG